jgi:hypothetical protein
MVELELIFVLDKQVFSTLAAILESVSFIGINECFFFPVSAGHVKLARQCTIYEGGSGQIWWLPDFVQISHAINNPTMQQCNVGLNWKENVVPALEA